MPQLIKTCRRKIDDDEFYTQYKDVEKQFKDIDLSNRKIICPCDTEQSNIYKYLKDQGYNVEYDSTEGRNVDYSKYDLVITNPPFKQRKEFMNFLIEKNIDFYIVVSNSYIGGLNKKGNNPFVIGRDLQRFIRPDGSLKAVHCNGISNRR